MSPLKDSSEIQEAIRLLREISEESERSRTGAPWEAQRPPFPAARDAEDVEIERRGVDERHLGEMDEVRTAVMQLAHEGAVLAPAPQAPTSDTVTSEPAPETRQEAPAGTPLEAPFPAIAATGSAVEPVADRPAADEKAVDESHEGEPQPPWVGMVEARAESAVQSPTWPAFEEGPPGGTAEVY
ncbi:MAG: hypothetical protein AB1714_16780 [Acidobacteriota bacterium]